MKLLVEVGESCEWFQREYIRGVQLKELQLDEIWAFVGCKEEAKRGAKGEHPGDVWCWTALDPQSKLITAWHVGGRGDEDAKAFCFDLATRVCGDLQITTDGLPVYRYAVPFAFHHEPDASFAQLVKRYGKNERGHEVVIRADKVKIFGAPDMDKVSTSLVERQNLTIRMGCRRYTRKTNAFSKKLDNHCAALALHFFYYNFCRIHMTIKTTPAVAAGLVDEPWKLDDLLAMHDARWAKVNPVNRPKTYRKRAAAEENSN